MSERDFKNTPTEVLEKIIGQGTIERDPAMYELQRRLSKLHWTLTPAFWVAVAAMLFAAIAAFPVIQGWFLYPPPVNKAASSQQQQSQSELPSLPESKKSPPVRSLANP